jgi:hypothetical protein
MKPVTKQLETGRSKVTVFGDHPVFNEQPALTNLKHTKKGTNRELQKHKPEIF